jgi:hypothetical protein
VFAFIVRSGVSNFVALVATTVTTLPVDAAGEPWPEPDGWTWELADGTAEADADTDGRGVAGGAGAYVQATDALEQAATASAGSSTRMNRRWRTKYLDG